MKKVLALLLIAIIGLFAFVACNPDSSLNEELVNVTITSRDTRSLEASTDFDISSVTKWTYTAEKADNGLKTGATETEVELKDGKTQQLSQGSWNFKLFGYKDEKLICSGKTTDPTTITVDKHTITILVGPQQTGEGRGTIEIKDDIKIVDKNGNSVADNSTEYTKTVTVKNSTGTVISDFSSVNSGMYYVEVVYTATAKDGAKYVAASAKKYFNVYDNLTTTISGTVEETTQSGEAKPEAEKVVASVDGVYFDSIADAINAATAEKPLVLIKDATLEEPIDITKDTTIDLGQYKLDLKGQLSIKGSSEKSATLTLKNGFLNSSASGHDTYGIAIEAKGGLKLETVEYLASSRAIKIKEHADNAALEISNSRIITDGGAMAIQTDATKTEPSGVVITIKNSHIEAKNCKEGGGVSEDTTALLFNIDGTLTIKDSTLIGDRQGVIVRGGTATISNSEITSSGAKTDFADYTNSNWEDGNEVPLAALVVGNRSNSYRYQTNVELKDVELSTPNENTVRKSIYVYQNDTTNTVTVTGNIKGEYTVNEENTRNGALVFPEAKIGDSYYQTLGNALSSINTTNEVTVDILVNNVKLENALGEYLKQNDNNVVLKGNGLDKTILNLNYKDGDNTGYIGNSPSSNIVFKDLTLIHNPNNCNYRGFYDSGKKTFSKCKIIGKLFLYSETEFTNCILENFKDYCIWTYGSKNVSFEDCIFETGGKAILVYNEKTDESFTADIVVTNCIFNDDGTLTGDDGLKAAIENGSNANNQNSNKYNLVLSNNVVNGFAINPKGTNTNSTLWANKNSMDADHLTVTIDGNKIQ